VCTFDDMRRPSFARSKLADSMRRSDRSERKIVRDDDRQKGISTDDDDRIGDVRSRRSSPSGMKILRIGHLIEKYFFARSPAVG